MIGHYCKCSCHYYALLLLCTIVVTINIIIPSSSLFVIVEVVAITKPLYNFYNHDNDDTTITHNRRHRHNNQQGHQQGQQRSIQLNRGNVNDDDDTINFVIHNNNNFDDINDEQQQVFNIETLQLLLNSDQLQIVSNTDFDSSSNVGGGVVGIVEEEIFLSQFFDTIQLHNNDNEIDNTNNNNNNFEFQRIPGIYNIIGRIDPTKLSLEAKNYLNSLLDSSSSSSSSSFSISSSKHSNPNLIQNNNNNNNNNNYMNVEFDHSNENNQYDNNEYESHENDDNNNNHEHGDTYDDEYDDIDIDDDDDNNIDYELILSMINQLIVDAERQIAEFSYNSYGNPEHDEKRQQQQQTQQERLQRQAANDHHYPNTIHTSLTTSTSIVDYSDTYNTDSKQNQNNKVQKKIRKRQPGESFIVLVRNDEIGFEYEVVLYDGPIDTLTVQQKLKFVSIILQQASTSYISSISNTIGTQSSSSSSSSSSTNTISSSSTVTTHQQNDEDELSSSSASNSYYDTVTNEMKPFTLKTIIPSTLSKQQKLYIKSILNDKFQQEFLLLQQLNTQICISSRLEIRHPTSATTKAASSASYIGTNSYNDEFYYSNEKIDSNTRTNKHSIGSTTTSNAKVNSGSKVKRRRDKNGDDIIDALISNIDTDDDYNSIDDYDIDIDDEIIFDSYDFDLSMFDDDDDDYDDNTDTISSNTKKRRSNKDYDNFIEQHRSKKRMEYILRQQRKLNDEQIQEQMSKDKLLVEHQQKRTIINVDTIGTSSSSSSVSSTTFDVIDNSNTDDNISTDEEVAIINENNDNDISKVVKKKYTAFPIDDQVREQQREKYIEYQKYLLTELFYALTNRTSESNLYGDSIQNEQQQQQQQQNHSNRRVRNTTKGVTSTTILNTSTVTYNRQLFKSATKLTSQLQSKGYWLDFTVSYCDWIGIVCSYEDHFIDQQKIVQRTIRKEKYKADYLKYHPIDEDHNSNISDEEIFKDYDSTNYDDNTPLDYEINHVHSASVYPFIPDEAITRIEFGNVHGTLSIFSSELIGTIPGSILTQFEYLLSFVISHNNIHGTIPDELGEKLQYLQRFDITNNFISGTIPWTLFYYEHLPIYKQRHHLRECSLANNLLTGTLPVPPPEHITTQYEITNDGIESVMFYFDISQNILSGTIPPSMINRMISLEYLFMTDNQLFGTIPSATVWDKLTDLQILDISNNQISGIDFLDRIRNDGTENVLYNLQDLNLANNNLYGTFPMGIFHLPSLQVLFLNNNYFTGSIPRQYVRTIAPDGTMEDGKVSVWSLTSPNFSILSISYNQFTGPIPISMITQLRSNLRFLDLSYNEITGTIPTEIGSMFALLTIDAYGNYLDGTIPNEMINMNPNLRLNFTNNLLTGTIPSMFCGQGASSMNMLYRENGCDAVLCRPGTFNIHGHATLHSSCARCVNRNITDDATLNDFEEYKSRNVLGQTTCYNTIFIHGDLNGDGFLSPREILRMLYVDTLGRFWGRAFQTWADMSIEECKLAGITCVDGEITRLDMSNAEMCSNGDKKPGPKQYCKGIPSEIGLLTALEVIQLQKQPFLRGTIPNSITHLSSLRILDVSRSALLSGTIPSEIGGLTNLRKLLINQCRLMGTIPRSIGRLSNLERFHIGNNMLIGTIPKQIGNLKSLKELVISRNLLTGTIPTQVGRMVKLENFEAYLNNFGGKIPAELALPTIKRIDMFGNQLSGTIPETIARVKGLQILHLKDNQLTGTIPYEFGDLPYLTWFDVSQNYLHGTIPSSFGLSTSIEDFRIVDNYIHGTIPDELCTTNVNINNGAVKVHGCDGIACPQGSYNSRGHATADEKCEKCPEGYSTLYMSSTVCEEFTEKDIWEMFFEVMDGHNWPAEDKNNWSNPDVPLCEWGGMVCDESGEVISVAFPLESALLNIFDD